MCKLERLLYYKYWVGGPEVKEQQLPTLHANLTSTSICKMIETKSPFLFENAIYDYNTIVFII